MGICSLSRNHRHTCPHRITQHDINVNVYNVVLAQRLFPQINLDIAVYSEVSVCIVGALLELALG